MPNEGEHPEPLDGEVFQNAEAETEPANPPTSEAELAEPAAGDEPKPPKKRAWLQKIWNSYKTKKKLAIPLTVLVLLLIILAIPLTRYAVLGLFIKKDIEVTAVDSKSGTYIGLLVTLDGREPAGSDGHTSYPPTFLKVPVGKHRLKIESGYYKTIEQDIEIKPGKARKQAFQFPMEATGRSLTFVIGNKITGKPVADLRMKSGSSESITDASGQATIVVDPSLDEAEVEISGKDYNTLKIKHKVESDPAGNFAKASIVPTGKVYFLSKKSGRIDVVKTDLDGESRQTVLAGTGREEDSNTILLASRDWSYLALLSRRDGDKAKLYLIDTNGDKLTEIDSGDASFTPVGWHDHYFVYKVYRNNIPSWQPRVSALKTYNAENLQLTTIDETAAEGAGDYDYAGESFGDVYILKDRLVYFKNWYGSYYSAYRLADKRMGIYGVKPNGSGKQVLKDFAAGNNGYISGILYKPDEIYFSVIASTTSYYEYEDGSIKETKDINGETFYKFYPTYLVSPGGQTTFWYEPRDGKNTLFTGTQDGSNPNEVASLSQYVPYGWYSDDYLLVSKDNSELFILPAGGPGSTGQILKVSDYHKPNYDFRGYGYGYGGY